MTKNPFINALLALVYIIVVASVMTFASKVNMGHDTFVTPIAVLSVFTLSAAVMGYIFLYEPAQLYFDNKKKQAVDLFLKTVASFGIITIAVVSLLLSGLIK